MSKQRRFTFLLLAAAAICCTAAGARQLTSVSAGQDDPAYPAYKKAYEMILHEQWEAARKAFRELAAKYPKSEYRDDAEYWIAYSWRDTDEARAMKAYREFLKNYRQSPYFDDALADLDQMMARSLTVVGVPVPVPDAVTAPAISATPNRAAAPAAVTIFPDDSAFSVTMRSLPAPAIAPTMKMWHVGRVLGVTRPGMLYSPHGSAELDDETRIRLEALYAVGKSGEDEKGFGALKSIAINPREKQVVRVAAMEALTGYRRHDVLPVFIEIARNDTSEEMQLYAIESIGSAAPDREKAFDALVKLYGSVPAAKVEKRKMVFYSIAEIGNERAVDFLADVARTGPDPDLRREAVYYLGTIGGEKARAVLIDLLNAK
jgi:hypothetical protein